MFCLPTKWMWALQPLLSLWQHRAFHRRLQNGDWTWQRHLFKWKRVAPEGQGVTFNIGLSHQQCSFSGVSGTEQKLRICVLCKEETYCSKTCQAEHWPTHKTWFKQHPKRRAKSIHPEKGAPQTHPVSLVGKRCIVESYIQGKKVQALWDTGSQVSIIDKQWKVKYLPNEKRKDISEVLDSPENLQITAANGQNMPFWKVTLWKWTLWPYGKWPSHWEFTICWGNTRQRPRLLTFRNRKPRSTAMWLAKKGETSP